MTAVKRTDDVVRALRKLVDRGVDAYLCLVGDGPDREHLERYAHELGVVNAASSSATRTTSRASTAQSTSCCCRP